MQYKINLFLQAHNIELNLHRFPFDRNNEPLSNLFREFSMQAHHAKFIISANGFIQINLNLVGSVSDGFIMKN